MQAAGVSSIDTPELRPRDDRDPTRDRHTTSTRFAHLKTSPSARVCYTQSNAHVHLLRPLRRYSIRCFLLYIECESITIWSKHRYYTCTTAARCRVHVRSDRTRVAREWRVLSYRTARPRPRGGRAGRGTGHASAAPRGVPVRSAARAPCAARRARVASRALDTERRGETRVMRQRNASPSVASGAASIVEWVASGRVSERSRGAGA